MKIAVLVFAGAAAAACACSSNSPEASKTDAQYQAEVVRGMHQELVTDLTALASASQDLRDTAPTPSGRGWDEAADAAALTAMREAWHRARSAYERVEGAIAPLFPDVDAMIDARYDDFLVELGPGGDTNLFDDVGVTGMHGVERILYSKSTPARVIEFESALPGYVPASFPASETEAADFKNKLCTKLATDTQGLQQAWSAASNFDLAGAFAGLIALMSEQREKVDKASTNEEESRYAQNTMRDIRDNLAGTRAAYAHFQPWIRSKTGPEAADSSESGAALDERIMAGFATLDVLYSAIPGDAIPETPADFSAENPSAENLATPFGQLYVGVRDAVDPDRPASVVHELNKAAVLLGFSELTGAQ
jgi:iron uptake system component EfeO